MPVYTYRCKQCDSQFDLIIRMSKRDEKIICEKCKSTNVERALSAFSVGSSSAINDAPCQSAPSHSCTSCPHSHGQCGM